MTNECKGQVISLFVGFTMYLTLAQPQKHYRSCRNGPQIQGRGCPVFYFQRQLNRSKLHCMFEGICIICMHHLTPLIQFYPPFAESNLFYRVAHLLPQAAHAHARLDTRQLQMLPRVCDKLI